MKKSLNIRILTGILLAFTLVAMVAGYISIKKLDASTPTTTTQGGISTSKDDTASVTEDSAVSTTAQSSKASTSTTKATAQNPTTINSGTAVAVINQNKWYLTYVGRNVRLPDNFTVNISPVAGTTDGYHELDTRAVPFWDAMYHAAKADGCTLAPFSGHRRIATQKKNYENLVAQYVSQNYSRKEAEDLAAKSILPPGTSEHNLGLAMDIVGTSETFDQTKEFKWLTEHAAEYGFILRYPKDKQEITNIKYEPWHWRYVGKEAAMAMKASGQCFEEYLGLD